MLVKLLATNVDSQIVGYRKHPAKLHGQAAEAHMFRSSPPQSHRFHTDLRGYRSHAAQVKQQGKSSHQRDLFKKLSVNILLQTL